MLEPTPPILGPERELPPRRPRQELAYWAPPIVLATLMLLGPALVAVVGPTGGASWANRKMKTRRINF